MVKLNGGGMKLLGQDGREIPTPPDMILSLRSRLAVYARQSLVIAGVVLVGGLLRVDAYQAFVEAGWAEAGRRIAVVVVMALGCGLLTVGLCALIAADFWPWTRKDVGLRLERQVAGLTRDELAREIENARSGLAAAPNARLRAVHADWLSWLEAQAAARPATEPLDPPVPSATPNLILQPVLSVRIMMACIGAPFLALAVWVSVDAIREHEISWMTAASMIGVAALGAWVIGAVWTVRLRLTPELLELRAFWRTRWSIPRPRAEIREGMVGDGALLPGYRVFDAQTGEVVGEIAGTQFRRVDLERLAALLPSRR